MRIKKYIIISATLSSMLMVVCANAASVELPMQENNTCCSTLAHDSASRTMNPIRASVLPKTIVANESILLGKKPVNSNKPMLKGLPVHVSEIRKNPYGITKENTDIRDLLVNSSFKKEPVKISDKGLYAAQLSNGKYILITGDTRYIITNMKIIKAINAGTFKISSAFSGKMFNLKELNLSQSDLHGETIGRGNLITVFVDPLCPNCHEFLNDVAKYLDDGYAFKIVPVSVISNNKDYRMASKILSGSVTGMVDRIRSRKEPVDFANLEDTQSGIRMEQKNREIYLLTQSRRVPLFMNEHGNLREGYAGMPDLFSWLSSHR